MSTPVTITLLRKNIVKYLCKMGHAPEDSGIIADVMLFAELRANNQGVIKLVSGAIKHNPSSGQIRNILESPVSVKVDGGQRIGMVVMEYSVSVAIQKAKISGICVTGCSNYSSATGALGYWARKITDAGLIGIVMSQCNEMVAPYGSFEPIFGTNPFAIGIPTTPRSQILDMATSASAYFGIKMAEKEGKSIPNDVAYDANGNPTTNPTEALKGAIRVFDRSFKGSHIALMVELLAGAFTGAAMEDKANAQNWGSLIIAIDPSIMGPVEEFRERAQTMCERVKNAKKQPSECKDGVIYLPGERGDEVEAENLRKGTVDILETVWQQLLELNKE